MTEAQTPTTAAHTAPPTTCMECGRDTAADWMAANEMTLALFTSSSGIKVEWDPAAGVFVGHVEGTEVRSQGRSIPQAIFATSSALIMLLKYQTRRAEAAEARLRILAAQDARLAAAQPEAR